MKLVAAGILLSLAMLAYSADPPSTTLNYAELAKYRCPFGMFNQGHPALLDDGNIMFCDAPDAICPRHHFCSAGYPDGRNVCCHILAYSADPQSTTLNYEELAKYRCPFGMFNMGHPALLDDGNIMFCDGKDVVCPNYHFCAGGYSDGRAVCCHILGP